jgi:hypothetical protein
MTVIRAADGFVSDFAGNETLAVANAPCLLENKERTLTTMHRVLTNDPSGVGKRWAAVWQTMRADVK